MCIYKEEDDDWECRATLEGHTSTVWSLSFDPEGQRLASCSDDRTVKIWKDCGAGKRELKDMKIYYKNEVTKFETVF